MRYFVERDCVDFSGRFFKGGTEVELDAGRHSKYLRPLDVEECKGGGLVPPLCLYEEEARCTAKCPSATWR